MSSNRALYFNTFIFDLSENTDIEKLRNVVVTLVKHVQVLRSQFIPTPDGHAQVVRNELLVNWQEMSCQDADLKGLITSNRSTWWESNREIIKTPMALILVTTESKRLLCLNIFHAIYDGISLPILLNIIISLYKSNGHVEYGPKFHEVLPYGPLCPSLGAMDFWKKHLEAVGFSLFSSENADNEKAVSTTLDITLESIDGLRKDLGTTHQALIQASWMFALQNHVGRPCCTGMVISGRSIDFDGADKTLGPLFNTIPFYLDTSRSSTWTELVQACHEFNVVALSHQHTALRDIMKWCCRSRDSPLFDTVFVFQREMEDHSSEDGDLWTPRHSEPQADFSLSFEAIQMKTPNRYIFTLLAQQSALNKEQSMKLLSDIEDILRKIIASPSSKIRNSNAKEDLVLGIRQSSTIPTGDQSQNTDRMSGLVSRTFDDFRWSTETRQIQSQLAIMTGTPISSIEPQSSIFELGLDSIDAIKLSSRLKDSGISLSVSTIMRQPTIQQMIEGIGAPRTLEDLNNAKTFKLLNQQLDQYVRNSKSSSVLGKLEDIEDVLPATPLQEAMVAEMIASDYENYFNHDILRIHSTTNLEKLQLAWDLVVTNSPILRTSFVEVQDSDIAISYAQIIHQASLNYWTELETKDDEELEAIFTKAKENAKADAKRGALFKLTSLHHQKVKFLILSVSHALYDGWSLSLLHEDIIRAYNRNLESRPPNKEILEHIYGTSRDQPAKFWKENLFGAQRSVFSGYVQEKGSSTHITELELASNIPWTRIELFCQSQRVALQALGQTTWALLLAIRLQQLDVVFGAVLSGRDTEDANSALFPTMNTVAVRSILHGSLSEMLQDMQNHNASTLGHQHFPLQRALALASPQGGRLFDSLFIVQKKPSSTNVKETLYKSIASISKVEVCLL